jgi:uncharacterized membrane protein (UPF0127 family)
MGSVPQIAEHRDYLSVGESRGAFTRSLFMAKTKLIVNLTRGECVCVGELADGPLRRMRGLIGRRGLPAGEGLLITPAPAIHTAFMRFPIDALFLDRELRVLDIAERLRPWRIASKQKARSVLELAAGECARRGVEVGDRLELRDRRVNGAAPSGRPVVRDTATHGTHITSAHHAREGALTRLQPLRVLVISSDLHFRNVVSLLLARRNCSVTTTANAARVTELIVRESADVVVVDDTHSPAAATVATVEALERPVGVVLVADEVGTAMPDLPVVAKWGPFGDLLAAIEAADERSPGVGGRR